MPNGTQSSTKITPELSVVFDVLLHIDKCKEAPSQVGDAGRYKHTIQALIEALHEGFDAYQQERAQFFKENPYTVPLFATYGGTSEEIQEDDEFDANFLEYDEYTNLPPPEWLIYDVLPTVGINFLVAPAKSGKTYVAISWACTIALEPSDNPTIDALDAHILNWCDRVTRHGHVIYIAGEDVTDIGQRIKGWAKYHHINRIPNLHIFQRPLQIASEHGKFMKAIDRRYKDSDVKLIVIDTLAMCTAGIEENSKKEFDGIIAAAELLWRTYNCCVLVLHHSGRNGKGIRGTSAIDGAAYTLIEVQEVDEHLVLHCAAKRRGRDFDDIPLDWQTVELDYTDETGVIATTSIVTQSDFKPDSEAKHLTDLQQKIIDVVIVQGGKEVPRTEVINSLNITEKQERGIRNAINALIRMSLITSQKKGKNTFYDVTENGMALKSNITGKKVDRDENR